MMYNCVQLRVVCLACVVCALRRRNSQPNAAVDSRCHTPSMATDCCLTNNSLNALRNFAEDWCGALPNPPIAPARMAYDAIDQYHAVSARMLWRYRSFWVYSVDRLFAAFLSPQKKYRGLWRWANMLTLHVGLQLFKVTVTQFAQLRANVAPASLHRVMHAVLPKWDWRCTASLYNFSLNNIG